MQLQQGQRQRQLLLQQRRDDGCTGSLMHVEDGDAGAGVRRSRNTNVNRAPCEVSPFLQPLPLESRVADASRHDLLQPASSALGTTWIRRFLPPGGEEAGLQSTSHFARATVGRKGSVTDPRPSVPLLSASLSTGLPAQNVGMAEEWMVVSRKEERHTVASSDGHSLAGEEFSEEWGHRRQVTRTVANFDKENIRNLHPKEANLAGHTRIYIAHGKTRQEQQVSIEGTCELTLPPKDGKAPEDSRPVHLVTGFGPFKVQVKVPSSSISKGTGMDTKLKSAIVEGKIDARVKISAQSEGFELDQEQQRGRSQMPSVDQGGYLTMRTAVLESRERGWTAYDFDGGSKFHMIGHEEVIQESVKRTDRCGQVEAGASFEPTKGVQFTGGGPATDKFPWPGPEYVVAENTVGCERIQALDLRSTGENSGHASMFTDRRITENRGVAWKYTNGIMDANAIPSHKEVIQESVRRTDHCGKVEAGASFEPTKGVQFTGGGPATDKFSWPGPEYVVAKNTVGCERIQALDLRSTGGSSGHASMSTDTRITENRGVAWKYTNGAMDANAMPSPEDARVLSPGDERQYRNSKSSVRAPIQSYGCSTVGKGGQGLVFSPCLGVLEEKTREESWNSSRAAEPAKSPPVPVYSSHTCVGNGRDDRTEKYREHNAFPFAEGHRHGDAGMPTSATSELAAALRNKLRYTSAPANQFLEVFPATRIDRLSNGTEFKLNDGRYQKENPSQVSGALTASGKRSERGLDPGRFAYDRIPDGRRLETSRDEHQVYGSSTSSRRITKLSTSGGNDNCTSNASPSSLPLRYHSRADLNTSGRSREHVDAQRLREGPLVSEMQVSQVSRMEAWDTRYEVRGTDQSDTRGKVLSRENPHVLHEAIGGEGTSDPSGPIFVRSSKQLAETAAGGHQRNDIEGPTTWLQRWVVPSTTPSSSAYARPERSDTQSRRGIPARDLQPWTAEGGFATRDERSFSTREISTRATPSKLEVNRHPSAAAMAVVSTAILKSGSSAQQQVGSFRMWPAVPMYPMEGPDDRVVRDLQSHKPRRTSYDA